MIKSKIKRFLKPIYLELFRVVNRVYFNIFIRLNKEPIKQRNSLCTMLPGEKVLILAPHIDDDIIGCGGAILKYLENGKDLAVAYLTECGKYGSKLTYDEIVEERKQEAVAVAQKIGLEKSCLLFLPGEDGGLINSNINDQLEEIIVEMQPDVIFMPCMLDTHSDHYAVTEKLCILYEKGLDELNNVILFLYEGQSPLTGFYSNVCLDIRDVWTRKERLMNLYVSQHSDFKFVHDLNKVNGLAFGKRMICEAFLRTNVEQYCALYVGYLKEYDKYLTIKDRLIPHGDSRDLIKSYKSSYGNKTLLRMLDI
ncbi:MAG TPA: PIG-L family deacetylase [Desulfatiglandales bacterium]|nr:PIG-L family deacetylase [Desulfatiglandales bacterium]